MNIQETRNLGIEFERRVQTMIPETEIAMKLDTETIYSYLNQYQDKFIRDLYKTVDQVPVSNVQQYIEKVLNSMSTSFDTDVSQSTTQIQLPSNFGLYISSYSKVDKAYEYKGTGESGVLTNKLVAAKDVPTVLTKPYDNMRIIRTPIVWLGDNNKMYIQYDRYTNPTKVFVNYYRIPQYMDLMTSTPCELPMDVFDELVTGAVDLYVQYVAGAEARKRQQAEQQQKQQKQKDNE